MKTFLAKLLVIAMLVTMMSPSMAVSAATDDVAEAVSHSPSVSGASRGGGTTAAVTTTTAPKWTEPEYDYTISNNEVTITGYGGTASKVVIPSVIEGYPVTSIGEHAFSYCRMITDITIPDGVTSIGCDAFSGCESLTSITIPEGVTSIGSWAFSGCESLTSITIPDSVTYIGNAAFSYCISLADITLPDGITCMYADMFYNTAYYNNVFNWENEALYIGNYLIQVTAGVRGHFVVKPGTVCIADDAFSYCRMITDITIPASVKYIGYNSFALEGLANIYIEDGNAVYDDIDGVLFSKDRTELILYPRARTAASYTIPNGVTAIWSGAFSACRSLTSITLPDSITIIGGWAFSGCDFTSITLPDSITIIGDYAFGECYRLKSISIPDGVTHIGERAFSYCFNLIGITLPKSVKSIGYEAFTGCDSLVDVYYAGSKQDRMNIKIDDGNERFKIATWYYDGFDCTHQYTNACDASCDACGAKRTVAHKYAAATCSKPKTCTICGVTSGSKLAHSYDSGKVTKAATCKTTGIKTHVCMVCGETKTSTIAKLTTHTYKTTTTKATLTKNGSIVKKCSVCGKVDSTTVIKSVKSFKLSATEYTYDGKVKNPSVTVKDASGKTLKKGTDYTVTYASGCKNVGTYKVTIKMKGNYSGTKTLTFKIHPPKTTVSKLTAGKKAFTVSVTKKSGISGYQIQYSTSKSFSSATSKTITGTKLDIKNLKASKTYYVRVRTYKTVNGKKVYSDWSAAKSVKTKK